MVLTSSNEQTKCNVTMIMKEIKKHDTTKEPNKIPTTNPKEIEIYKLSENPLKEIQ